MKESPRLPDESSLPAADRPAWPLERIRDLLASRKPATVLWALERAAAQRVSLAEEITGAASRLLDQDDEGVFEPALTLLRGFAGHPFAREVAKVIAERLPSFGEGTYWHCLALEALARLAPAEHVEAFVDGLENSGDEGIQIAAVRGIALGRGEGAIINLLGFMGFASEVPAALALAGLCDLRAAEFAERGAELFLERFVGYGKDIYDDFSFSELCSDIEDALAGWMDLHWRVEDSLFDNDDQPVSRDARASVFLPTADTEAARRAREILGPEGIDRIFSLADDRAHETLKCFVGDLALQAIRRASRENPAFGPLGQTLAGLVGSILEWDAFVYFEEEDQQVILGFLGSVLAKAIRGHDIARELENAGDDRAKLLELCRVDEDWVDQRAFELLARALREEDAASLTTSTDCTVSLRGLALLAAMDPVRHGTKAVVALIESPGPKALLFRGLVSATADAVLPPLVEAARAEPAQGIGFLTLALELLGTERARACLEHSFDAFRQVPPLGLLGAAGATGSRLAVEKTVALIRDAAFDVEEAADMDPGLTELRARVEACLEVLEIPGDPDEIFAEAVKQSGRALIFDQEDLFPYDDDDEEDEDEDEDEDEENADVLRPRFDRDDPDLLDPEDAEPVEPIVRDAPKVGRNDPCPCGSGKKHKKCCGKGS